MEKRCYHHQGGRGRVAEGKSGEMAVSALPLGPQSEVLPHAPALLPSVTAVTCKMKEALPQAALGHGVYHSNKEANSVLSPSKDDVNTNLS